MREQERYNKIVSELEDDLIHTRWENKAELNTYLKEKYDTQDDLEDVDKSGLVSDYAFIVGINKNWGYIDIYYLKIPYGDTTIYITEVSVSDE